MNNIVRLVDGNTELVGAMTRSTGQLEQLAAELARSAAQFRL
jgi:methyl-accepting chemotaxis protein